MALEVNCERIYKLDTIVLCTNKFRIGNKKEFFLLFNF